MCSRFLRLLPLVFLFGIPIMFFPMRETQAVAPAVVTNVLPVAADGKVTLTWTNPASGDFTGTMVRYSTAAFPTTVSDGTLAANVPGSPSGTSTTTVNGLTNGTTYYFSLFAYNAVPEYSTAVNAHQLVMTTVFTEDFQSRTDGNIDGQNGWDVVGGTWTVVDTTGEKTLRSGTDNLGFHLYRALNGGNAAAYTDQMVRADWKGSTTSLPGQIFLRAQSATDDAGGYFLWQNANELRISYKTTTGAAFITLAAVPFTPVANTWYTYEFSVVNNNLGQSVLSGSVWQRGTAKPASPTVQYTDTFNRFAQGVFSVGKTNTAAAEYDNVTFYGRIGLSGATVTPGNNSITLAWTNSAAATYAGTVVRSSTSAYPASPTDGTAVATVTGSAAGASSTTHSGLVNGTTYYYTLFPYDNTGAYGTPIRLRQVPYPSLFTDDFASSSLASVVGQNGWTSSGGTWTVSDLSGNRVVGGTSSTSGFYLNKIYNSSTETGDQILRARFQSNNATNYAGQFWLRQQSATSAGYLFWHNGNTWTLFYTTAGSTSTTLATSANAAPMEANVWYNVEASALNNGSSQPVLRLFVWKEGTERPAVPTIEYTDTNAYYLKGMFALGKSNSADIAYYDDVAFYGSAPTVSITSPAAAVAAAPDVATLAITDEGGTFYIPYIQTSTTLNVSATAGTLPAGGGLEFVLNEGLASQQSVTDLSAPYTASFSNLAKGEYTLDVYALQGDGTTRFSDAASHDERTDIGIGDIITVIGDSVTEGNAGTIDGGTVANWLNADAGTLSADNRQFPQHGSVSNTYKESFLTDLNDKLAAYYGYPVFLMNEGRSGIRAENYQSTVMTAGWQSRQTALAPNKWLISLGLNDAYNARSASQYQTDMTSLLTTLTTTYGATGSQIYLAYPNYDFRNGCCGATSDSYLSQYLSVIDGLRTTFSLQGGPDLYHPTENYKLTDYADNVHPNATGYVRIARLWALALMKPVVASATVSGHTATVSWGSLSGYESSVSGYRVNYGTTASTLTSTYDAGNATSATITGLGSGKWYYFSVEAYDNDASDRSYSDDSDTSQANRRTSEDSAPTTWVPSQPSEPENDPVEDDGSEPADETDETPDGADDNQGSEPREVLAGGTSARSPYNGTVESVSRVTTGMFVRGMNFPTVYFIDEQGTRRPFMDAQTYFTHADSFSEVTFVSDATLPLLPMGTPMLPLAKTVLVKIESDPRVYAITENPEDSAKPLLRWIPNETTASTLFGSEWSSYIIDLPPTLMSRFTRGENVAADESDIVGENMKTRYQIAVASML